MRHPTPTTPVELIRAIDSLDADALARRLAELERERSALVVLLRASRRMRQHLHEQHGVKPAFARKPKVEVADGN